MTRFLLSLLKVYI